METRLATVNRSWLSGGSFVLIHAVEANRQVAVVGCASREVREDIAFSTEHVSAWRDQLGLPIEHTRTEPAWPGEWPSNAGGLLDKDHLVPVALDDHGRNLRQGAASSNEHDPGRGLPHQLQCRCARRKWCWLCGHTASEHEGSQCDDRAAHPRG